ncbi:MAG: hypothetical protein ACOH2F_10695 [Cellulomonas sp.]
MTDSTRGTWGADDLPTPPVPHPAGTSSPAPHAPESRAARRAAASVSAPAQAVGSTPTSASARTSIFTPTGSYPPPSDSTTSTGDEPTGDEPTGGGSPAEPGPNRRRNLIIAAAIGGVVIIGGVAAALGGVFDTAAPLPTPTASTITLASPTPTIAPIAREPISAFADALPSTVLDLALTAIAPQPTLVAANALEGYTLDYSDGGSVAVTLEAGQWETPEEAAAVYAPIAAAAPVTESGSVDVGGAPVGTWTFSAAADGTGSLVWTNGTALFHVTGPAEIVRSFYEAFPL